MNKTKSAISVRWFYLAVGVISMLFAGILYAWSILKSPLSSEFGWGASDLALNFTLAMSFFCIGGLLGAQISKRMGHRIALLIAGVLSALGFILTASLRGTSLTMLYISYGLLAGLGIGIAYNVIIATVSAWFPDKKGLCSGFLMMGFGASALILGNVANLLFNSIVGWRTTYMILGISICIVLVIAGLPSGWHLYAFPFWLLSEAPLSALKILEVTGGYTTTFMMLLALSAVALILNVFIRRP